MEGVNFPKEGKTMNEDQEKRHSRINGPPQLPSDTPQRIPQKAIKQYINAPEGKYNLYREIGCPPGSHKGGERIWQSPIRPTKISAIWAPGRIFFN
jgi:hypothetical protein